MPSDLSTQGKWILTHGIHRGTITSRDTGAPEEFDSRDEAVRRVRDLKREYARSGYVLWFAKLVGPDGEEEQLDSNTNYR